MSCAACGLEEVTCLFHIETDTPHIPSRVVKSVVLTRTGGLKILPGARLYTPRDVVHEVNAWLKDDELCVREAGWDLTEEKLLLAIEEAQREHMAQPTPASMPKSSFRQALQDLDKHINMIRCPFCGAVSVGTHTRDCKWNNLIITDFQEENADSTCRFEELLTNPKFLGRTHLAQPVGDARWKGVYLTVHDGMLWSKPESRGLPFNLKNFQGRWCLIPSSKCK